MRKTETRKRCMQIGGFVKQSSIDWDGKLAAVVFTRGCNLRCFYCHNPTLVLPNLFRGSESIKAEEVLGILRKRAGFLDGVVVTGGEPTIQPDLLDFLREIKSSALPIKLDTNGTNPKMLSDALSENLLDCVAMDIKHKPDYASYKKISPNLNRAQFENILESIKILRSAAIETIFRTTLVGGAHSPEDAKEIAEIFPAAIFQKQRKDFASILDYTSASAKSEDPIKIAERHPDME